VRSVISRRAATSALSNFAPRRAAPRRTAPRAQQFRAALRRLGARSVISRRARVSLKRSEKSEKKLSGSPGPTRQPFFAEADKADTSDPDLRLASP